MSYDLHTPFGIIPGQVSPAEQLQAQTVSRMRGQAMQDDADSARLHALKASLGDGAGSEPDFSFATGPKDTGAVNLAARNAMVMQREQGDRSKDLDFQRLQPYQSGEEQGLAREGRLSGMREDAQLGSIVDRMMKDQINGSGGAAPAAGPVPGMNPNVASAPADGINLNAMGGGSAPSAGAAAGGGQDLDKLLRLMAARSAARTGQPMPDFAGRDYDLQARKQRDALDMEGRKMDMDAKRRSAADADAASRLGRPADQRVEDFLAVHPDLAGPLAKAASTFGQQDTSMVGWDPGAQDEQNLVNERDTLVRELVGRGYSSEEATGQANLMLQRSLGPYGNASNAGRIKALLKRLGLAAASGPDAAAPTASAPDAAPAAPAAYSPFYAAKPLAQGIARMYPTGAFGGSR